MASSTDDGMSASLMANMHSSMAATLWNESSGGIGAAVDGMLDAGIGDLQDEKDKEDNAKNDKKDSKHDFDLSSALASSFATSLGGPHNSAAPMAPSNATQSSPQPVTTPV